MGTRPSGHPLDGELLRQARSALGKLGGIAAFLLHLHDTNGKEVHCYFNWTQSSPLVQIFRYVLLEEGTSLRSLTKYLDRLSRTSNGTPFIHVVGK